MRRVVRVAVGAGMAVGVGIWLALRPPGVPPRTPVARRPPAAAASRPRPARPSRRAPPPDRSPLSALAIPQAATASGNVTAAWEAVAHASAPAMGIQTAIALDGPGATWAVVPAGVMTPGLAAPTLWAGVEIRPGHWRWWPITLPGAIPPGVPLPFRDTLGWAYDLHAGMPGPHGLGQIPWSAATGRVGEPVAWTLRQESGAGPRTLILTVWMPVLGAPATYFGLVTRWDRQNRATGDGAITLIQVVHGESVAALVRNG